MLQLAFIALGGALGAMARYALATHVSALWATAWPLGTLMVNSLGSLLIGIVFVLLEKSVLHPDWRSVLMVGFLGAFTTFSTFSLEAVELWLQGAPGYAMSYALISTLGCIAAAAGGMWLARAIVF